MFCNRATWTAVDAGAWVIVVLAALWWAPSVIWPVSDVIYLKRVEVADGYVGEPIELTAHRTIYRNVDEMCFYVEVRDAETTSPVYDDWLCRSYEVPNTGNLLVRTVEWWTDGFKGPWRREAREPGDYYIKTRHCFRPFTWSSRSCNPWNESNVFTLRERPEGRP